MAKSNLLETLSTHLGKQPWDTDDKGNFRKTARNTVLTVQALNQALLDSGEICISIAICAACEVADPIPVS